MTTTDITSIAEFAEKETDPDRLISMARVAESAERFPDMCILMSKLVKLKCDDYQKKVAAGEKVDEILEVENRNLLSVAYKNVVGTKRNSWRQLSGGHSDDEEAKQIMLETIENELVAICQEVIALLGPEDIKAFYKGPITKWQNSIKDLPKDTKKEDLPAAPLPQYGEGTLLEGTEDVENQAIMQPETIVFYLKMVGDYCRYLAEINNEEAKGVTEYFYQLAYKSAKKLPETHPTRLGLALNFSVCYYEIMKKPHEACTLAKDAFDGAIEKLDTLNDASYKDSTLIMQLLRDNLTLWTSDNKDNMGKGEKQENP